MNYYLELIVMNPFWSLLIIAFIISTITVLVYKFTTNQKQMKEWRDEQKELQKKMRELKDKPEEMARINKRLMEINSKYMIHSLKPTLFTLLPIILIFGWLQGHFAYDPITPGQEFGITIYFEKGIEGVVKAVPPEGIELVGESEKTIQNNAATFAFKGKEGIYKAPAIDFSFGNKTYSKEIVITKGAEYIAPEKIVKDGTVRRIVTSNPKKVVVDLGFLKLGWLWSYIIFSIVISMALRKILKVY